MILKDKAESEKIPKSDLDIFHKYSKFTNEYRIEKIVSYEVLKINSNEVVIVILSQIGVLYIYALHLFQK